MNEQIKLILALREIDSLTSLLEGNEYQQYLYYNLIQVRVELQRQLSHYGTTTY
jgi:hypothetical protein